MKISILVRMAILLMLASTMSGCIWAIDDDGNRRGNSHERDRGDRGGHIEERHDGPGGRR